MRISLSQTLNYPAGNYSYNTSNQKKNSVPFSAPAHNSSNINFKSYTGLMTIAIYKTINTINKNIKFSKFKNEFIKPYEEIMENPEK